MGRQLVERIAEFLCTLPNRPVTPNESPQSVREVLGMGSLPEQGAEAKDLLEEAANLLFEHSTFNGHPRFWGVITSNAMVEGKFLLRACMVNFRTSLEDMEALPALVIRIGKEVDTAMRGETAH